eukprot:6511776-Pyramimonas_sp.AAC.1
MQSANGGTPFGGSGSMYRGNNGNSGSSFGGGGGGGGTNLFGTSPAAASQPVSSLYGSSPAMRGY